MLNSNIVAIVTSVSAFIFLMCYTFLRLDTVEKKKSIESLDTEEKQPRSATNSLEAFIERSLDIKTDAKARQELALHSITGKALPISIKLKQSLSGLMYNPYNTISVPKMIICSIIGAIIGFILGGILTNIVAMICLTIIGTLIPFTLVSILAVRRQLIIQEGNVGLISTHLGIYKTSNTFLDSLRQLETIMSKTSREYPIVRSAYLGMVENSMSLGNTVDVLKKNLLADDDISQYLDTCCVAESTTPEYKEALEYTPVRLDPVIRANLVFITICYFGYYFYIGICLLTVGILFYYKFLNPDQYVFLTSTTLGKFGTAGCMMALVVLGLIIGKISNIITLTTNRKRGDK